MEVETPFAHFTVPSEHWVPRVPIERGGVHSGWMYVHRAFKLPLAVEHTLDPDTLVRNGYRLSYMPKPTEIRARDAPLDEQIPETVARNVDVPFELAAQHAPTLLNGIVDDYATAVRYSNVLDDEDAEFMFELFMLGLGLLPAEEYEALQRGPPEPTPEQRARRIVKAKRGGGA